MTQPSTVIICEYCDSAYQQPSLAPHQRAHCQRCGAVIARYPLLSVDQLLALSIAAALFLAFLCFSPMLYVQAQAQRTSATLVETAMALAEGWTSLMALTVMLSVVVIPALQLTLLIWLLWFARQRRRAPGFQRSMRTLELLRPWSMLEVILLAALVSVVKMTGRVEAAPALGIFVLGALSLVMIGVAGRDIRMLWQQVVP